MTTGFTFSASCPRCGGELLPIDHQEHGPDHVAAEVRCDVCLDVLRIEVVVTVVEPWPRDRLNHEARRRESAEYAAGVVNSLSA